MEGGGGGDRLCDVLLQILNNQKEKYDVVMDLLFLSSYFVLVACVIIMIRPVNTFVFGLATEVLSLCLPVRT